MPTHLHSRRRHPRLALLAFLAAFAAAGALANTAVAGPAPTPHAASSRFAVRTYRIAPKVQRTVRSTGYATYTFKAPAGRRIFAAQARIVGAQRHAVAIRSRRIANNATSYTVNLVFPGEQGNPGKLVVRLVTIS